MCYFLLPIAQLSGVSGTILGELAALRLNKDRTLTIRAKSPAVVYCLWADDFEESLSDKPEV